MKRTEAWILQNQQDLAAVIADLRGLLQSTAEGRDLPATPDLDDRLSVPGDGTGESTPPAFLALRGLFALSAFELRLLLLCAAAELDGVCGPLIGKLRGKPGSALPTFGLALSLFDDAHWSAIAPSAPLRKWGLVNMGSSETVVDAPLRLDERILHYLTGVEQVDAELAGSVSSPGPLVPVAGSRAPLVRAIVRALSERGTAHAIQVRGRDVEELTQIAAFACALAGREPLIVRNFPAESLEADRIGLLWQREAILEGCVLVLVCPETPRIDAIHEGVVESFLARGTTPAIVLSRQPIERNDIVDLECPPRTLDEQRAAWNEALRRARCLPAGQPDASPGVSADLAGQFDLGIGGMRSVCATYRAITSAGAPDAQGIDESMLWDLCRAHARLRLTELAQYVDSNSTWDDLVLPDEQLRVLKAIVTQVRQRQTVYCRWGFGPSGMRGLGVSALFAGDSGTGKSLAAEVIAADLHLDLFRIDLSQMVSKYIGETEKNLSRIFEAGEEGGAILLFDEADALFGRRSEVKDSHDRYANIEVSYLLQRMESYRGLAILTTNMKAAIDPAFLRRLRFIISFPFPDVSRRADIWRKIFPRTMPRQDLDYAKLAKLNVAGGTIRNVAMNAAFMAAGSGELVGMSHLLSAARMECAKIEKPVSTAEIGGWV